MTTSIYSTNHNILILNENVTNACLIKLKTDYCKSKADAATRQSPLLITQPSSRASTRVPTKIVKWPTPLIRKEYPLYANQLPPFQYVRNPNPHILDLASMPKCKCPK